MCASEDNQARVPKVKDITLNCSAWRGYCHDNAASVLTASGVLSCGHASCLHYLRNHVVCGTTSTRKHCVQITAVVAGPPGAGTSTQVSALAERYGLVVVTPSDVDAAIERFETELATFKAEASAAKAKLRTEQKAVVAATKKAKADAAVPTQRLHHSLCCAPSQPSFPNMLLL
jgi:hypothetical protein